jgi:excisionase family DNA binding protein
MTAEQADGLNARLHPVEAVMERLCLGRSKVFELIANGQLRSVQVGRRRLVSEAALREFIEKLDRTDGDDAA